MASSTPTSTNASELFGHGRVETLSGQTNYVRWYRDLKAIAQTRNLWSLISGEEDVLERPERPVKPQSVSVSVRTTRSKAKAATTDAIPEDSKDGVTLPTNIVSDGYKEAVEDYKLSIQEYRLDLDEFEKQDARLRLAKGLLSMSVDPAIRSTIAEIDNPHDALTEIKSVCQMSDARALGIALSKLEDLKFTRNDTVSTFMNNVILLQNDINELDGSYSDHQIIAKVIRSLPSTFSLTVSHWNMFAGTPSLPNTVKELYSQLLSAEAQQPQKPTRATEPRPKNARNASDKPANRLLSCCNKYGTHKEEDCWSLHPELRNDASKSPPKPRANAVISPDNKPDEKKDKDKEKNKKPSKVTAQALVGNRELFEALCSEAFETDLDLTLTLAINTPLPFSDDDFDLVHIPGAYPESISSDSTVSSSNMWQDLIDSELASLADSSNSHVLTLERIASNNPQIVDAPAVTSNLDAPAASAFIMVPFEDSPKATCDLHLTHSPFGIDLAPSSLLQALSLKHDTPASDTSSFVSLTSSEEVALTEAMDMYVMSRDDDEAQLQLQRELQQSIAHDESEGTPTSSSLLPATFTDSLFQTTPSGSEASSIASSRTDEAWTDQCYQEKGKRVLASMMVLEGVNLEGNAWIADSGASISLTNNKAWFDKFRPFSFPMGTAAGDENLLIEGGGTVTLQLDIGDGEPVALELRNVAYAPTARCNILSLSYIAQKARLRGSWSRDELTITTAHDILIGIAPAVEGLYHLQLAPHSCPVLPPRAMLTHVDDQQIHGNESNDGGESRDGGDSHNGGDSHDGGDADDDSTSEQGNDARSQTTQDVDLPDGAETQDVSTSSDLEDESSNPGSVPETDNPPPSPPPFPTPEVDIDYDDPVWTWHRRLGHLGFDNMIKLLKVAEGIDLTEQQIKARIKMICPVCATTKAVNRVPRDPATHRRQNLGELVHIDMWGPYPVRALDGTYYILALIDDATRFTWTERLSAKHQLPAALKKLHKRIERRHSVTIATYRFDNELPKYNKVVRWVEKHGVTMEKAVPYQHYMNGVVERGFRTGRERSSAMLRETHLAGRIADIIGRRTQETLANSSIPEELWPQAFELAVWLKNRAPSRALKGKITPWEALYGSKPDLSKEKIFGSRLYLTSPPELRQKTLLLPRGRLLYFVGYESEAVVVAYNSDAKKIERVSSVRVDDGVGTHDVHDQPSFHDRTTQAQQALDSDFSVPDDVLDPSLASDGYDQVGGDISSGISDQGMDNTADRHAQDQFDEDDLYGATPIRQQSPASPRIDGHVHDNANTDLTEESPFVLSSASSESEHPSATEAPVTSHYFFGKGKKKVVNMVFRDPDEAFADQAWYSARMAIAFQLIWSRKDYSRSNSFRLKIFRAMFPTVTHSDEKLIHLGNKFRQMKVAGKRVNRSFSSKKLRQEVDGLIDGLVATQSLSNTELHTFSPKELMFFDEVAGNYNKVASLDLYNDIFSDLFAGGDKLRMAPYTRRFNAAKVNPTFKPNEEQALRRLVLQDIKDSTALHKYIPGTEVPNRKPVLQKCNSCKHANMACIGKPCTYCVQTGRPCTFDIAENVFHRYYPDDIKPEWTNLPDPECCYNCDRLSRQGRKTYYGDGGSPCNECIKQAEKYSETSPNCTRPLPDGGYLVASTNTEYSSQLRKTKRAERKAALHADLDEEESSEYSDSTSDSEEEEDSDAGDLDLDLDLGAPITKEFIKDAALKSSKRLQQWAHDSTTHSETPESPTAPTNTEGHDSQSGDEADSDEKLSAMEKIRSFRHIIALAVRPTQEHHPDPFLTRLSQTSATKMFLLTSPSSTTSSEPRTHKQALSMPDAHQWKLAMEDEYTSLLQNNTWNVVLRPHGKKILSTRWVFKKKLAPDGSVAKYKARFVVRGFTQVEGQDYDETYASVVKATSYRLLFALQARYGWKCHQMDVKTAFLHGDIEHDLYIQPPEGFPHPADHVLHLNKALYGLKQSPRQWAIHLSNFLTDNGWVPSKYDPCIFIHQGPRPMFIDAYVDDIKIFAETDAEIESTKALLNSKFSMTDLGSCSYYLGLHVEQRDNGDIHLHQAAYIHQVLERFGMLDIHPCHIPMRTDCKLTKNLDAPKSKAFITLYQSKVGSLLYLSCIARPDIAEAVGVVSRFNSNPGDPHMAAVDHILAYIKATPTLGLHYASGNQSNLHAYSDADWGGCKDTARSTSGWVVMLSGAPISWSSKRQKAVALSTCESEYIAAHKAAQELVWLTGLLQELGMHDIATSNVPLHMDNEAALKLTRNPEFHDRSKHINIKFHYLRELNLAGVISTRYVNTKDNLADLFTKPLPRDPFKSLVLRLGLTEASDFA